MEYPQQGETVLYSTQGITHKAIVLHVHFGQVEHLGKNGEPLLHLAFIAPERESEFVRRKSNFLPSIFTEFDVVHHSQEFSDGFKRNNSLSTPAQIAVHRGQGEWREVESIAKDEFDVWRAIDCDGNISNDTRLVTELAYQCAVKSAEAATMQGQTSPVPGYEDIDGLVVAVAHLPKKMRLELGRNTGVAKVILAPLPPSAVDTDSEPTGETNV